MEILNLNPVVAIVVTGMVAGVVELVKRLFKKPKPDWKAVATILGAGITGALCIIPFGINPLFGAVFGLASSGFVTIAQHVNN